MASDFSGEPRFALPAMGWNSAEDCQQQAFIMPSKHLPRSYRSIVAPTGAFVFSAILHEAASLTVVGHTSPYWWVTQHFLLMALGMTLEICFKKITGRKVQGLVGWIWTWIYILFATEGLVETWLGMGLGGALIIPRKYSLASRYMPLLSTKAKL